MVNTQIIRCPICLLSQPVSRDVSADKELFCGNCKRKFSVKNGLPLNEGDAISFSTQPPAADGTVPLATGIESIETVVTRNFAITWLMGAIIWLVTINYVRPFIAPLKGQEFLAFYMVMLVATWLALSVARKLWEDSIHVTLIALLIYEGVGLVRYMDASAAGMHKFSIMFIMMGIGGVFLFARGSWDNQTSGNGSDCSSYSSCSGCGGGGGCGGCGD